MDQGSPFCVFCGAPSAEPGVAESTTVLPTSTPSAPPPPLAQAPRGPSVLSVDSGAARAPSPPPARTLPTQGPLAQLFASLTPATALVFAASALAFGLPSFVYAYSDPIPGGYGNGAKFTLGLLLAVTIAMAVAGAVAAAARLKVSGEDHTAARLVFGVGIFASVFALLQFFAALGR